MKIVQIINGLDLGGTETALFRFLCNMNDYPDYSFVVIVLGETGYYSSRIEALGIPIYHFAIKKNNAIKKLFHLLALLKKLKPDVVQTWLYHADLFGGFCAKLSGVRKIIWGIRCEGIGLKKTTTVIKQSCALLSWFIPDFIIANSKIAAENHVRAGYSRKKMRLVYNGFDTTQFSLNRKKTINKNALPDNVILIGSLARFHKDKDYHSLIQSIDAVCELHPEVYFILCGEGCNPNNAVLKKMLSTLQHQDHVILIDGVEDTATYLNNLTIFVLTSKTESFPNSLAEAMLCELPCIATDVGEIREILGNTGLLVPRENPKQLTSACLTMLKKDPLEKKQLGISARNRIKALYSIECNQTRICEIYNSCVD